MLRSLSALLPLLLCAQAPPHEHYNSSACKDRPDAITMKSGHTYYACIHEQSVCSEEPGAIPQSMIDAFDAGKPWVAPPKSAPSAKPAARRVHPPVARAKPAPKSSKLSDAVLDEIAIGADRDAVVTKLGRPYSKITGDVERFTYRLASGGIAKIDVESGRVTQIKVVAQ